MQSLLIVKQTDGRAFRKPAEHPKAAHAFSSSEGKTPRLCSEAKIFPFRVIREEQGMSQKTFSQQLGIDRTRLVRLEKKTWPDLCTSEIELLIRGLGLKWKDLLHRFKEPVNGSRPVRGGLKLPCFTIDSGRGYRIESLLDSPKECFIGTLRISPKQTLACDCAPAAPFLFFLVLEGEILANVCSKEYVLRERESFLLEGVHSYEFYNPHQLREASLIVFSLPSFMYQL